MAFSSNSGQSAMSEINVTPLVDVMLVLLVVFIVTAPLLMQAVKVNLPKTAPVSTLKQARPAMQISVDAAGQIYLDRRPLHSDALEAELKNLHAADANVSLQVHADDRVPYGRVALVMAAAQRAGIARLSFVTTSR